MGCVRLIASFIKESIDTELLANSEILLKSLSTKILVKRSRSGKMQLLLIVLMILGH